MWVTKDFTRWRNELGVHKGVMSVHFGHPHELSVAYDPLAISPRRILELVRVNDKAETKEGL